MTTPRHRWLRFAFSLRTLFVVMTIACAWLGMELRTIHARRTMLAELESLRADSNMFFYNRYAGPPPPQWSNRPGTVREWLGDEGHFLLCVPWKKEDPRTPTVEQMFPESLLRFPIKSK